MKKKKTIYHFNKQTPLIRGFKYIIMNPYEPILQEIANGFLETAEQKPNFSNNAFLDATLIFQTVFLDKLFDHNASTEIAENCGNELRKLIIKYTGLDTVELVKNYKK